MNDCTYDCIDAGTENCPCYLALTGDCLTCSRLQGKDTCDCNWKGVCIYNEFKQGNGRVNNPRNEFTAGIVHRKFYLDDLAVFVLDVGKGFAIKSGSPGSYIFMRGRKDTRFYDIPISVMHSDVEKGQIHVAIKVISSKTKTLLAEEESFILRGVYRNGILGLDAIRPRNLKNAKVLLVAKGIGLAPAILTAESLCHGNQVDLVVDTEKISTELVSDYLEGSGAETGGVSSSAGKVHRVRYLSLGNDDDRRALGDMMKDGQYDSVAVLASDFFVEEIGKMAKEILPAAKQASSNNFRICCGEGICGACSFVSDGGETIKMCKCQMK